MTGSGFEFFSYEQKTSRARQNSRPSPRTQQAAQVEGHQGRDPYRSMVETHEMLRSAVKVMDWLARLED